MDIIIMPEMITITKKCPMCGKTRDFVLEKSKYLAWKNGAFIQTVFPEMSADDREQLISGLDAECWNKFISDAEDDENE